MNEDKLNQSILTKAHLLLAQMIIVFGLVITGGCQSAGSVEEANSIAELQAHMDRYAGLFNAANAEAIAKEIYAAPIMVVNPDVGEHTVYETEADVRGFWAGTFSAIKSKGWVRSVVHDTKFQMAGQDMAIAKISLMFSGRVTQPLSRTAPFISSISTESFG